MRSATLRLGFAVSFFVAVGWVGAGDDAGRVWAAGSKDSPPTAPAKANRTKAEPKPAPSPGPANGAPAAAKGAAVTLTGELTCAKCGLHEASACQSVLVVKEGGKVAKYYLAPNAVAEAEHEKVCGGSVPATITGTVTEEGGRKIVTATTVATK